MRYSRLLIGPIRPLSTRLAHYYGWYLLWHLGQRWVAANKELTHFRPEAVLTVSDGFGWRAAWAVARQRAIPLHLVMHDEWDPWGQHRMPGLLRRIADNWFAALYSQASDRYCVSPFMADACAARYGAPACVLYPARSGEVPTFQGPPVRSSASGHSVRIAYAGSVYQGPYAHAIAACARAVEPLCGQMIVYTRSDPSTLIAWGITANNVRIRSLLPARELVLALREEADILLVPMSFAPGDRGNVEVAFPSKLADYTASGLAILVWGPPYCSAVRWARENPGVAAVVDSPSTEALHSIVAYLASHPEYRQDLGRAALDYGESHFSHDAVTAVFRTGLLRTPGPVGVSRDALGPGGRQGRMDG